MVCGTQINYVTLRWGWSPTLSAVFFILVGCGMALYPRLLIPRFGEEACLQAGCVISIVNSVLVGLDPTGAPAGSAPQPRLCAAQANATPATCCATQAGSCM